MSNTSSINHSVYVSCIKIAGTPILPPMVTEERRKELIEYKSKAIAIEKRIKRKRSSIDSGVMTGSYIDNLKNTDLQTENSLSQHLSISDFTSNENLQNLKCLSPELDSVSCDNFLRSALEDSEFRDFFYSTAEKIFKDNSAVDSNKSTLYDSSFPFETNAVSVSSIEHDETEEEDSTQPVSKTKDLLDNSDCATMVSSISVENKISKCPGTIPCVPPGLITEEVCSPPQGLVRRNSYTLDSPSPVLLEHMAKEQENTQKETEKWKTFMDKKESMGFKTFLSETKPRKKWIKNVESFKIPNKSTLLPLKRSKTFVKTVTTPEQSNCSLPSSSRTSPTPLSLFGRSVDCIQTLLDSAPCTFKRDITPDVNLIHERIRETKPPLQTELRHFNFDNEQAMVSTQSGALEPTMPNGLSLNNSSSLFSNCDTYVMFPVQYEASDSSSQISTTTQSTLHQPSTCNQNVGTRNMQSRRDDVGDLDDSASVCSSLSLSKFMPLDSSRPSTTEDLSVLFSELQFQHECEIKDLLEKQHKEKILFTKLHSNSESLASSRSTTNLSIYDLSSDTNLRQSLEEKRGFCGRELFPSQISQHLQTKPKDYNSDKVKAAALKITSFVRGYLTRRLLKTEKVQQLIDTIKESLSCAFSLQSEPDLNSTDLELHKRLEHQLNAALCELQSIISAPVSQRMAIIATDREKLRKPLSRPTSAISLATKQKILRRQQSLNSSEKNPQDKRERTKSLCLSAYPGLISSASFTKIDSVSTTSPSSGRKPWK